MQLRATRRAHLVLLVVLMAAGISMLSAAPLTYYKLSKDGPLPIGGDVYDFKISANGVYTVYRAGQDVAELAELYAARNDTGQPPVKLSALPRSGQYINEYDISPNNAHVVYSADQDTRSLIELYSARLDGSGAPVKLSGPMVEGGGLTMYSGGFRISPDGSRVVYRAEQETIDVNELYSVPVDGSAAPVKLNAPLPAGGSTNSYKISPDSQYVVYTADQDTDNVYELYRAPIDSSSPPIKLSGTLVAGGSVTYFTVSPDSAYVVYLADQDTNDVNELYVVPLDGSGPPVKLNSPLVPGGNVAFAGNFFISPDSLRVIYIADQDTNDVDELYSVPITGGTVTKLNPPMVPGGEVSWVWEPQISPDSSRVVYFADQETNDETENFRGRFWQLHGVIIPCVLGKGILVTRGSVFHGGAKESTSCDSGGRSVGGHQEKRDERFFRIQVF